MVERYDVEIGEEAKTSICPCCGKSSYTGHGFVYKSGNAYAVYYVGWSPHHRDQKVSIALAVGEWDDSSTADDRVCFGLEAYESGDEILFRVIEPKESPWSKTDLLGSMLSRKNSLAHRLLKEVFIIVEEILRNHSAVRHYLNMPDETASIGLPE